MNSPSSKSPRAGALQQSDNNFAIFEPLEDRLFLDADPTFGEALGDYYWLNTDGKALTLGIDGEDIDGDILSVSISADDATGLTWEIYDQSTSDNRYAVMHYFEADGVTPIGDIVVQLFEDRAPIMTERFITLSTKYVDEDQNIFEPTTAHPAYYTDVNVHRIIDEFMFQCGDAQYGNGSGGSPFESFDTETDDHLAFTNGGVLAAANAGANATDSQWFITEIQYPSLDGEYTIFGQIISGWDVYEQIISTEVKDDGETPENMPILGSIDIQESPQDATVSIWADEAFTGPAEITITLDDGNGGTVDHIITIVPQPVFIVDESISLYPDTDSTMTFNVTYTGNETPTIVQYDNYSGPGELTLNITEDGPGQWQLEVQTPAEYDGSEFQIALTAVVNEFDNRLPDNAEAFDFGYGFSAVWIEILSAQPMSIGEIADISELAPGDSETITLEIEYAGDLENDLDISVSTTYDNGGTFEAPEPFYEDGTWKITLTMPAEYDGQAFDVTVSAESTIYDAAAAVSESFSVQFGVRPEMTDPGTQLLDFDRTLTLPLSFTDDPQDLVLGTSCDNEDVDVTIDADGNITITAPDYRYDTFTITVTAVEADLLALYSNLAPAEYTFDVKLFTMDAIADIDDLAPDESRTIEIPINYEGDLEKFDLTVSSDYDNGGELDISEPFFDNDVWKVTITTPKRYDGLEFNMYVSAVPELGYGSVSAASESFSVKFGTRPVMTIPDTPTIGVGETLVLPLTFTDDIHDSFVLDASCDNDDVTVSIDNDGNISITAPDDYLYDSFTITVTAVEAELDNLYSYLTPSEYSFNVKLISMDTIADVDELEPGGDSQLVELPIEYHADHADLTVSVSHNYDNGGVFVDPAAFLEDGVWKLNIEAPAEYDGQAFDITVTVIPTANIGSVDPISQTFSAQFGQRPEVTNTGFEMPITGGEKSFTLDILPGMIEDYTITAVSNNPEVTVELDSDTYVLTITAPAGLDISTVTLTAIERDYDTIYSNLTPFEVTLDILPIGLGTIDDQNDMTPGESRQLVIPILLSGEVTDDNTSIWTTTTYDTSNGYIGRSISYDDGVAYLNLTMPEMFDGQEFSVTVYIKLEGITDSTRYEQTFNIKLDQRPEVDAIERQFFTAGSENEINITVTDDETDSFHIEAVSDNSDVTVEITDEGLLTITTPDQLNDTFTITVSVWEKDYYEDYSNIEPTTIEIQCESYTESPVHTLNPDGDTEIIVKLNDIGNEDVLHAVTNTYTGDTAITATITNISGYYYRITITAPDDYNGSDFDITYGADYADDSSTSRTITLTTGARPTVELANNASPLLVAGELNEIPLNIISPHSDDFTIRFTVTGTDSGNVSFNNATGKLEIDLTGLAADAEAEISITVWAVESGWDDIIDDADTDKYTLDFKVSDEAQFVNEIDGDYLLSDDGYSLTIPVDAWAPDEDEEIIISATTNNSKLLVLATNGNDLAELKFEDSQGNVLGSIFIELFEGISEAAVQRFLTLAANYYTDTPVYQLDPGSFFATGDPNAENGSGRSGLGYLPDDFGQTYTTDALGYAGMGTVGLRYDEENTADDKFFITALPQTGLNGTQMVIGQVISGWDVLDTILGSSVSGGQLVNLPIMTGVEIHENNQDGSVIIVPTKKFKGSEEVEITLSQIVDGQETEIDSRTITVHQEKYAPDTPEMEIISGVDSDNNLEAAPGTVHEIIFKAESNDELDIWLQYESTFGDFIFDIQEDSSTEDGTHKITINVPDNYDGSDTLVSIFAKSAEFNNSRPNRITFHITTPSQPSITLEQDGSSVPSSVDISTETQTLEYDLSIPEDYQDFEYVFSAEVDQNANDNGVSVDITPDADDDSYDLTVNINGFTGIIKLTITAQQDIYDGTETNKIEKIIYISNLSDDGNGIVINEDEDAGTPQYIILEDISDASIDIITAMDDDSILTFEVKSADFKVAVDNGDGTATATLEIPEGYSGIFELTFSVYYDSEFGEDFGSTDHTILVTVPGVPADYNGEDELGESAVVPLDIISEDLEGFDNIVTVETSGDMLFALDRSSGLAIIDNSDPMAPVVLSVYNDAQLTSSMSYHMKLFSLDDRDFIIIASGAGVVSVEYDIDGRIIGDGYADSLAAYDIEIRGTTAYIAAGYNGLAICDLSDPANPEYTEQIFFLSPTSNTRRKYQNYLPSKHLWTYQYTNVIDVELYKNYLFVAEKSGGYVYSAYKSIRVDQSTKGWIGIYNLSQSETNLQKAGIVKYTENLTDIIIEGKTLFVATESNQIKALSLSNPSSPSTKGSFESQNEVKCLSSYYGTLVVTTTSGYEFYDTTMINEIEMYDTFEIHSSTWESQNIYGELQIVTAGQYAYMSSPISGLMTAIKNTPDKTLESGDKRTYEIAGELVTFSITGGGTMVIDFDPNGNGVKSLNITGVTNKTAIYIKADKDVEVLIEDIVIDGDINKVIAQQTILTGDLDIAGYAKQITLAGVGLPTGEGFDNERVEQTISIGGGIDSKALVLSLGQIYDTRIISASPISKFLATGWFDNEDALDGVLETVDSLTAPLIKTIKITPPKGTTGKFEAGLNIANTLGSAVIKTEINEAVWDIAGSVKTISVIGNVTDMAVSANEISKFSVKGDINTSSIETAGQTKTITIVGDTDTLTIDADSVSKFTAKGIADTLGINTTGQTKVVTITGDASDLTIDADSISKLTVKGNIDTADLDAAGQIKSVSISGNANNLEIDADNISTLKIKGGVTSSAVTTAGLLKAVTIYDDTDNFDLLAGSLAKATIKGNLENSSWKLNGESKTIYVTGKADNFILQSSDSISKLIFGQLANSEIYAGYVAPQTDDVTGLPSAAELADGALFDLTKSIGSLTIKSAKVGGVWQDGMTNSSVAAGTIKSASIINPDFDNDGTIFGLASDYIAKLKITDKASKLNNRSLKKLDAADSLEPLLDDFYVRIV